MDFVRKGEKWRRNGENINDGGRVQEKEGKENKKDRNVMRKEDKGDLWRGQGREKKKRDVERNHKKDEVWEKKKTRIESYSSKLLNLSNDFSIHGKLWDLL